MQRLNLCSSPSFGPLREGAAIRSRPSSIAVVACGLALATSGCKSAAEYAAEADRDAYSLLEARMAELATGNATFDITPPRDSLRVRAMAGEVREIGPLTLVQCLEIAAEDSERYRTERESLFLRALSLALERWRFGLQPDATGDATVSGTGDQSSSANAGGDFQLSKLFVAGGRIIGSIGSSLFRVLSTGDGFDAVSDLGLTFTQPLLRDFSTEVTLGPLTQAERNLLYQARSFERFRRTFSVDVATQLYGLLEAINNLDNEERNLDNLQILRQRNEALAEAGQLSDIQADQARQDELRSQNRLVALRGELGRRLDLFKLFLGLPIDCELILDLNEFQRLTDEATLLDALEGRDTEGLVQFAWQHRLDVATTVQQVDDAARDARIAANELRTGLGVRADANSRSDEGRPLSHRVDDIQWSLGLDLDLPVNLLPQRNAYRSTLVRLQAAERSNERFRDRVATDVRDAVRQSINARATYQIQLRAVELANRRVESADLNLKAGRAATRDLLESQAALLEAQNALTAALIDFNLAMFDLYLQLEVLRVDETGIHVDEELIQTLLVTE